MAGAPLSSKWTGLNKSLLATIYPVDPTGEPMAGGVSVVAPLTDTTIELTGNWQSPFEQSGAEAKAPAIMAMLQSGTLESYVQAIFGKASAADKGLAAELSRGGAELSRETQGRSGMTKLNSTQVFTGSAPIKINGTIHFRAFDNPGAEVQQPIDQLSKWVLARELAKDGSIVSFMRNLGGGQGFLKSILPSLAPQMLAFRYGGYTFSPMVLESLSRPLTVPMTSDGAALHITVNFSLASLTALESADWDRARQGKPTQLFNN